MKKILFFIFLSLHFISCQCSREVESIHFGQDKCEHCKMLISDSRFGGAILSDKGKTAKFDSFECMRSYFHEHQVQSKEIYLVNFNDKNKLLKSSEALVFKFDDLRSPMGEGFVAFASEKELNEVSKEQKGNIVNFEQFMKEK